MRKLAIVTAAIVVLVVAAVFAWRVYSGPPAPPPQVEIGDQVKDFTLPDARTGQERSLADLRGENGTLLIFISTQCPYSNGYNQRMEALHRDYRQQGVRVVGINPNRTEPATEVVRHAREKGLTFTILKDEGNRIADYLGASVTPEAYLLDADGILRYHGRLDARYDEPGLNAREAREACNAVIEGETIANTGKKAFGCTIKRVS